MDAGHMVTNQGAITRLLQAAHAGESGALEGLLPLVYGELRGLAAGLMRGERSGHTLDPTALVHEAWLRLAGQERVGFAQRTQFFAAAGALMRRILVDHARARRRLKRGGAAVQGQLAERQLADGLDGVLVAFEERAGDLLALEEALGDLAALDARLARLVELRFFAGLEMRATAEALSISLRQAERDWTLARAWLRQRLDEPGAGTSA
jgi:RNA polymerase sigma factor (TIGR02999 family)